MIEKNIEAYEPHPINPEDLPGFVEHPVSNK